MSLNDAVVLVDDATHVRPLIDVVIWEERALESVDYRVSQLI